MQGVVNGRIRQPTRGFLLAPVDTYGLSLTVLRLSIWLQKRFHPSVRPKDVDNYRSRSYCFVERQQDQISTLLSKAAQLDKKQQSRTTKSVVQSQHSFTRQLQNNGLGLCVNQQPNSNEIQMLNTTASCCSTALQHLKVTSAWRLFKVMTGTT